ncbi:hypothetical protein L198_02369 [Cryptococcus wingfieldii CBS 7118]|uniref:DNA repair and recombination protein RAD52 n=1 Tax=Cryptococcus wingfieldii CBS 7118 TaxID=1295528 RepID=A0A1E3JRL6_9TREE|nr:hypothetical protein L198_02369 [Cryptococcus wingfieldii CBS 7118]ODO03521.1 hypothetical protein L198_02369 [Cryptococcus wingfieldii CBS 7118]
MSISTKLLEEYMEKKQQGVPDRSYSNSVLEGRVNNRNQEFSIASRRPLRMDHGGNSMGDRSFNGGYSGVQGGGNQSLADSSHGNGSFGFGNGTFTSTQRGCASQWSEDRVEQIQARLKRKLGPEYVTQRPGPGGVQKLSYIEGWKVINLANDVFGYNGWSTTIVSLKPDFIDQTKEGRIFVNATAIIRITLLDGTFHEDVGCGQAENVKSKGAAIDKAQKEAVTDATKRALRTFGNVLGNCLYDKEYTKEVVKMKVPPAKFQSDGLERRAEFAPPGYSHDAAPGPSRSNSIPPHMNTDNRPPLNNNILPPRNIPQADPQPPPPPMRPPPNIVQATPLKSVHSGDGQEDEYFFDENFDAEFAQFDDASMMAGVDGAGPSSGANTSVHSEPSKPERPAYQHRARPDLSKSVSEGPAKEASFQKPAPPQAPQFGRPAQHAPQAPVANGVNVHHAPGLEGQKTIPSNSSPVDRGVFGKTVSAPVAVGKQPPKVVGGFNFPGPANKPASSRAQAILKGLNGNTHPSPHLKGPESPRIPSGGVDHAALRATSRLATEGARLGFDENDEAVAADLALGGFASAKGLKRAPPGAERISHSPSPTKMSGGVQGRTALGELDPADWAAKRSRLG